MLSEGLQLNHHHPLGQGYCIGYTLFETGWDGFDGRPGDLGRLDVCRQ